VPADCWHLALAIELFLPVLNMIFSLLPVPLLTPVKKKHKKHYATSP
jgi:hypothetical protein